MIVLELLGLLLFIPFLGYLCSILREAEGPRGWLATTAFGAGLVDVTIKLGSLAPGKAADDFGETTAIHQALEKMNNVAYITTMLPLSVLMAAVAVITLNAGRPSAGAGLAGRGHRPALLVNGMFLDAEFGPASLLFLLWTLLASVVLTVRPSRHASATGPVARSSRSAHVQQKPPGPAPAPPPRDPE